MTYHTFVAPGLLATAAMNGALLDTTFNFFFKYKYAHTYDAVIATPLGAARHRDGRDHVGVAPRRDLLDGVSHHDGASSATSTSWWAVLAFPVAVLIAFGFAGVGLAATTFMRSFVDFDYVNMAMIPLFLFSATFFPLVAVSRRAAGDRPGHAAVPGRGARAVVRARRPPLDAARSTPRTSR